jgi:hypothetical protein
MQNADADSIRFAAALSSFYHSGQGRSGPRKLRCAPFSPRSKAFHRARPTLTSNAIPFVQAASLRATAKGRIISQYKTSMSYIQQFEAELAKKLESGTEDTASIVRWAGEQVLASYRNGITAGQKGAKVIRQGESRRRGQFGKKAQ